jgi:hypothetical protein
VEQLIVGKSSQRPIEASALLAALAEGPPAMAASALPSAATFMLTPETVPELLIVAFDVERTVTVSCPAVSTAIATDLSIARPITVPPGSLTMATEREMEIEMDTSPRSIVRVVERERTLTLASLPAVTDAEASLLVPVLTPVLPPDVVAGDDPPAD